MKISSTLLVSSAFATSADISGHLIAADGSFWQNASKLTANADAILRSVREFLKR